MNHQTIRIEGSILSHDILDKIGNDDVGGQLAKDFGFESKVKVKDEIAKAWADANSMWKVFKSRIENVKENQTGTSETRKYWMIPFLGLLGYDVVGSTAEQINSKSYSISHRDKNLDRFPVHIMGFNDSLDKKRIDSGPRLSPHSLVQEYLNLTDHDYALVTNGYTIRLLRDSSRLIKLSYIEFDLERMFEEDHYWDFAVMFRLLHSSRMPFKIGQAADSLIEKYHLDALDSGSRIRNGLSAAVKDSILKLGTGFLNHTLNEELINLIDKNKLDYNQYHRYLLRVIYRLLFIMVIEERGLIYSEKKNIDLKNIYYDFYSIGRLRKLCERRFIENEKHTDYWIHILNCFKIFEDEKFGKPLEIKPLAGDLFGYDAIGELNNCNLDNEVVIECIKNLSFFRNEVTGQIMRVNYRSLNVEEFGSVYEGLLEFKPHIEKVNGKYDYTLVKGSERSSSGSHYTEDELVTPLIKHSLDYIIEDKLKEKDNEKALLSITVCDVACGSGHILLNAARRIAFELAKARTGEDFPSPTSYRIATRDVIKNCIYGVDKNPLAVELCKIALWLESHNPGEPLSFLDHKIKCGDSIVGLTHKEELERGIATEAFNPMSGDDKEITKAFKKKNNTEIKSRLGKAIPIEFKDSLNSDIKKVTEEISGISLMPETNPSEVETKKHKYNQLGQSNELWRLKILADMQVAQFFIPKTADNKAKIISDSDYFGLLHSKQMPQDLRAAEAIAESQKRKFFHWFLEFPEIFEKGGFDCVLGNPPFLGGQAISGAYGNKYLNYIKTVFNTLGSCDLVSYFFNRVFDLLKMKGFLSLISTNTISQGVTREASLLKIHQNGGTINFALKSIKWPGVAAVFISLISIHKGITFSPLYLGINKVRSISLYLEEEDILIDPYILFSNKGICFMGSTVFGKGFFIEEKEALKLLEKDIKNKDVLYPILNGEDFLNNIDKRPSRWVINFKDMTKQEAANKYNECFNIIETRVKPQRLSQNIITAKEKWWLFHRLAKELYQSISKIDKVLITAITTKTFAFAFLKTDMIYSNAVVVFAKNRYSFLSLLQSVLHECWAWKYASTLKTDLRYAPSDVFETFPLPASNSEDIFDKLDNIGLIYDNHRDSIMNNLQIGLTKTYNLFHTRNLSQENNSLSSKIKISKIKACEFIQIFRELQIEMDEAVLEAYGWTDIELKHDFYEVDYLPENDRIRYTIHPDARKEILKRLLDLNHKIHEEEVAAGLWDKKTTGKKKAKDSISDGANKDQGSIF